MDTQNTLFTFTCPKCGVDWDFNCTESVLDQKNTLENDLAKIVEGQPVDINEYPDRYDVKPQRFLGELWKQLHQQLKPFNAQWIKDDQDKTKSHWTIPKPE